MSRTHRFLIWFYAWLVQRHPRAFREVFAAEIQAVFAALLCEASRQNRYSLVLLCVREYRGILDSLARQHWEAIMQQYNRRQRLALGIGATYLLSLALIALALQQASPGPHEQALQGLAIGEYSSSEAPVYLSGRRLSCTPSPQTEYSTYCTIEIAGKTLELFARRNGPDSPMQLSGACAARYDGQEWPCEIGSRHVHVHWFAYLPEPLGLNNDQRAALRSQYLLENLPDQPFMQALFLVPLLTAIVTLAGMLLWFWGKRRRVWLVLFSAVTGTGAYIGTFIATMVMTSGFWD